MKATKTRKKLRKIDLRKFVPRTASKGTPPGTVEYIGQPRDETVTFRVVSYNEAGANEIIINSVHELQPVLREKTVKWIQIVGVHDEDVLCHLGELFHINALELETIANTTARPSLEERDDYLFTVLKSLQLDPVTNEVVIEQVSFVLGEGYVLSFHETEPLIFDALRNRIFASKGRIRKFGADYLLFALCDILIDQYFTLLENMGEMIESIEEELIQLPDKANQELIYKLKRRLVYVKKTVWPTREVITGLQRSDHTLIDDGTKMYFRNIYDHTVQIIESLESLIDMSSNMMDLYLSAVSNRMNEIMKVLTIFSAIFIPITFLAGIYGMNFKIIPELTLDYGYLYFWIAVLIIIGILLLFFRKKKWM
jgi:magnesium transporter